MLYKAVCSTCENADAHPTSQPKACCRICNQEQPLDAFRYAQRTNYYNKGRKTQMACRTCEFPTCSGIGCEEKPDKPHIGGFMCPKCLYPPCVSCGRARPRQSHSRDLSIRTTPTWTCNACLHPPCVGCGKQRPNWMKDTGAWKCPDCRKKFPSTES